MGGRELEEYGTKFCIDVSTAVHKSRYWLFRFAKALYVGEESTCLYGEKEIVWRAPRPLSEGLSGRQAVKGAVDLYGRELRCVVLEPRCLGKIRRVHATAPVVVLPAGRTDSYYHRRSFATNWEYPWQFSRFTKRRAFPSMKVRIASFSHGACRSPQVRKRANHDAWCALGRKRSHGSRERTGLVKLRSTDCRG